MNRFKKLIAKLIIKFIAKECKLHGDCGKCCFYVDIKDWSCGLGHSEIIPHELDIEMFENLK